MKVFISWSGQKSRIIASKLREWLPDVIQSIEPWMSRHDINAGARWSNEVAGELSETRFGIICLTRENIEAPWILFEAGALSKTVDDTFVCPYLIDLDPADIPPNPLTQFQAKRANKVETFELLQTINTVLKNEALPEERLKRTFDRYWQDIQNVLDGLPQLESIKEPARSVEDMVSEILELVREQQRQPKQNSSNFVLRAESGAFNVSAAEAYFKELGFVVPVIYIRFLSESKEDVDKAINLITQNIGEYITAVTPSFTADGFELKFNLKRGTNNEIISFIRDILDKEGFKILKIFSL